MKQDYIDDVLGVTRCIRCGHRLEGEIECPFCSLFPDKAERAVLPKWIFITACFLTSPLSLYAVITARRLNIFEKVFAFCGCLLWLGLGPLFF